MIWIGYSPANPAAQTGCTQAARDASASFRLAPLQSHRQSGRDHRARATRDARSACLGEMARLCAGWRRWLRPLVVTVYALLVAVALPLAVWQLQKAEVRLSIPYGIYSGLFVCDGSL